MSKGQSQNTGHIKDMFVTANTILNTAIGQMTSTENIKKDESDGEQEPERQEDGGNGADYRGNNPIELLID